MSEPLIGYRTGALRTWGPLHIIAVRSSAKGQERRSTLCANVSPWVVVGLDQKAEPEHRTATEALIHLSNRVGLHQACRRCIDRAPKARTPKETTP